MNKKNKKHRCKSFLIYIVVLLQTFNLLAQNVTTFKGRVVDSETKEPLIGAIIRFENSNIGTGTNVDGYFNVSNNKGLNRVEISMMGYEPQRVTIDLLTTTTRQIELVPKNVQLNEVVIKSSKQKYSKKENPAVELIKKVIDNKKQNSASELHDYMYEEFERYIFAFNEFDPDSKQFRKYTFLKNYTDTSLIDNTPILPVSVKDKKTDVFVRNKPKTERRIVKAQLIEGLDQHMEQESIEAYIKETVQTIDIADNQITLLLNNFVSPLNSSQAVSFYKWFIVDTLKVDSVRTVQLDFAPFNNKDLGFTGSLYIGIDENYAVKKAVLNTPKHININWVKDLRVEIDYAKTRESEIWYPASTRLGIALSLLETLKVYIEKSVVIENFVANSPVPPIYDWSKPEVFEKDYQKRDKNYWNTQRPKNIGKDLKIDQLMKDIKDIFIIKLIMKAGNLLNTGYVATNKDPEKNKLEIGNVPTFYSYNSVEGNRFRVTLNTTKNFHPNFYLYGYSAYGTKDGTFKYMGEATWTFRDVKTHKEEYPLNNISVAYQYDMNALGQSFTQAERDNILMSFSSSKDIKLTYDRSILLKYHKEYYNGFSFKVNFLASKQTPAGQLTFERQLDDGTYYRVPYLQNTASSLTLKYAYNEKFMQRRRKRFRIPTENFISSLTYEKGIKGLFGGEFDYDKLTLSLSKNFWVSPYGKFYASAKAEKLWGKAPYPMLISPSANNSFTLQSQSYYLINPLEFIHDKQVSWEVYYHLGGFLFNRVPLLNKLKWREVVGFRGFYGSLSDKNNPVKNNDMLLFPQEAYQTTNRVPYMEYNIGIENIFKLFRVDYVRRINYKYHPNINKSGVRISFQFEF